MLREYNIEILSREPAEPRARMSVSVTVCSAVQRVCNLRVRTGPGIAYCSLLAIAKCKCNIRWYEAYTRLRGGGGDRRRLAVRYAVTTV